MSKFVILGDLHCGARNASPVVCEFQLKFFEEQLFPYMIANKITTILQLGDLFDSRKFSNHVILHKWKTRFFDVLRSYGMRLVTLLGNHDIASKNTLEISASGLFLREYANVEIVSHPRHCILADTQFLLLPWLCLDNEVAAMKLVEESDAVFCAGHFEFDGFEMQRGVQSHGGLPVKEFEKFDVVFSGHYHTKNKKENILYTGVPYEITWADYDDQKGFHVFDSKTHNVSFIKNEKNLFHRIEYNDKTSIPVAPRGISDAYVKVVVINKTNPYEFEKFIANLLLQSPADLKITDIEADFNDVEIDDSDLDIEDTKTLMDHFVLQVDTDLDKDKMKDMLQHLYLRALEITE